MKKRKKNFPIRLAIHLFPIQHHASINASTRKKKDFIAHSFLRVLKKSSVLLSTLKLAFFLHHLKIVELLF